jgi:transcriptional regulatory protein LevR
MLACKLTGLLINEEIYMSKVFAINLKTGSLVTTDTALNAVLTYRYKNTSEIIEEVFNPTQRNELNKRIDSLRAIQAQDDDGNFIPDQYIQQHQVDYMVTSFR